VGNYAAAVDMEVIVVVCLFTMKETTKRQQNCSVCVINWKQGRLNRP
jgi:hypothetical protein